MNFILLKYYLGPRKGLYLTHRVVETGSGYALAAITREVLEEYDSIDNVEAIIMDNTVSNTGHRGGIKFSFRKKIFFSGKNRFLT